MKKGSGFPVAALPLVLLVIVGPGCGSPTAASAPGRIEGLYRLQVQASSSCPAVASSFPAGFSFSVEAATAPNNRDVIVTLVGGDRTVSLTGTVEGDLFQGTSVNFGTDPTSGRPVGQVVPGTLIWAGNVGGRVGNKGEIGYGSQTGFLDAGTVACVDPLQGNVSFPLPGAHTMIVWSLNRS